MTPEKEPAQQVGGGGDARPSHGHFMLLGRERVCYAGLLGRPRNRTSGALNFYVCIEGRMTLTREDGVVERGVTTAVVPPYVPHTLKGSHPSIINILVEPETLHESALVAMTKTPQPAADFVNRVRAAHRSLLAEGCGSKLSTGAFDTLFFGAALPVRHLDRRVARAVHRINTFDGNLASAADCAAEARLSLSRFGHLFKDETGFTFRTMRAWKRARHLLHFVNADYNLAHLAQDIGYPDSTHFSHSIRRYHGHWPRAIFRGSRDLEIVHTG